MNKKVIFDNDYRACKFHLSHCDTENEHYYFLYRDDIYDMEDPMTISALQKRMVMDQDYVSAKNFNSYLIDVTRLKKIDEWLYYPSELQIEHTNRCNARCIMCGHYNADKEKCRDVDENLIKSMEFMFPFVRHIGIHGYGEPFLTSGLKKYFEIYKKYGIRLYVNTNMSYMPEEYYPYIRELFDEINISCESVHKDIYESIRLGLKYERFVRNIDALHNNCPEVPLNLFVVIMRQNLLELPDIVDFAADHGLASVQFTEMIAMDANDNYCDNPRRFPVLLSAQMKKANDRAQRRNIKIMFPAECLYEHDDKEQLSVELIAWKNSIKHEKRKAVIQEQNLLFDRRQIDKCICNGKLQASEGICDVFAGQMYCSLDGKIAACCVDGYHYTENIQDIKSMRQYWDAEHVRMLRECFKSGRIPSICNNCNFILLDSLKYLKITDRVAYQNRINKKDRI